MFTIKDLENILTNVSFVGNKNIMFDNALPIAEANKNSIVWVKISAKNHSELIKTTKSKVIICSKELDLNEYSSDDKCFVLVDKPKLAFLRVVDKLFYNPKHTGGYHSTALIDSEATIGKKSSIGAYSIIGKCKIGKNAIIKENVVIYDNIEIGENVFIGANTVIGEEGFGFDKNEKGEWEHFPHIGNIKIKDNVYIGPNCNIDRGTLGQTFIDNGVKIDGKCHIAHNTSIGKNTIICGETNIGGTTKIGENCWISSDSCIINGIIIEDDVYVGIGSVVIKGVDKGSKVFGNPARKIN